MSVGITPFWTRGLRGRIWYRTYEMDIFRDDGSEDSRLDDIGVNAFDEEEILTALLEELSSMMTVGAAKATNRTVIKGAVDGWEGVTAIT